jgi:ribonuclease HI
MEIYTDASLSKKNKNYIGIGILFIMDNDKEIKYHFDINKNIIINKYKIKIIIQYAELYAIKLSINLMKKLKKQYSFENIIIYTDSLNCFNIINMKKPTTNRLKQSVKDSLKQYNIDIRWIKSHSGVYGNEIADKLSKIKI